jgi:Family of unknown function (DUF6093)
MRDTSASALPDTCRVTRQGGEPTLNTTTGDLTSPPYDTIYTGACRLRPRGSQELNVLIGDLHETLGSYVVTLPHDAPDVEVDDYLTVTASSDADMVGRSFAVIHVGWSAWQIDRRIGVQDREQPPGIEVSS